MTREYPDDANSGPQATDPPAVRTGRDCHVDARAVVGHRYDGWADPAVLGDRATVRAETVVYADVVVGDDFATGHGALVREDAVLGDEVLVGTNAVVDGAATLGSRVKLQTGAYVPRETIVGDRVFLGPGATLTNDPYPLRTDADLVGPTLEDDVTIGANATVLPGVTVGEGSFVAAGSVVTDDVPPATLAVGAPSRHRELPDRLTGGNEHA